MSYWYFIKLTTTIKKKRSTHSGIHLFLVTKYSDTSLNENSYSATKCEWKQLQCNKAQMKMATLYQSVNENSYNVTKRLAVFGWSQMIPQTCILSCKSPEKNPFRVHEKFIINPGFASLDPTDTWNRVIHCDGNHPARTVGRWPASLVSALQMPVALPSPPDVTMKNDPQTLPDDLDTGATWPPVENNRVNPIALCFKTMHFQNPFSRCHPNRTGSNAFFSH